MAVRAVGTQFDVYRKDDGLVVTVVEGRVAVLPPPTAPSAAPRRTASPAALQDTEFLSAGEQLTVTPRVAVPKPHHADVNAATAWVQRRLVFDDTPLAEVAEEFNRYSLRRLVIDDAELSRKTISGAYSSRDPASLIGFLRSQPTLEVTETEREIRVARRGTAGTVDPQ
jgi:transmembrane sensor